MSACVVGATDDASSRSHCAQKNFCPTANAPSEASNYTNCIKTSLDSVESSSGGALLMGPPAYWESEDLYYRPDRIRYAYGVLNGSETSLSNPDGWNSNSIETTNNGAPGDYYTSVTLGDVNYVRWGRRTITHEDISTPNLFEPAPDQPVTDGTPPCHPIEGQGCFFSTPAYNGVWGTPESGAPVAGFPNSDDLDSSPGAPNTGASGNRPERGKRTVRLLCDYGHYNGVRILKQKFRTQAGMAIGIIGTSTTEFPDDSSRVADLGIICAPWSTASWTDNWNWLLRHMRSRWDGQPNTRENSVWQPILRLALPFMTEWRREHSGAERYVRPGSMKTCPPNYVLYGLGVHHRDGQLVGVNRLLCRNNLGGTHVAMVSPVIKSPSDSIRWQSYKFADREFHLSQRIGAESGLGHTYNEIVCGNGQLVGGIQINESSDDVVNELHLECVGAPALP